MLPYFMLGSIQQDFPGYSTKAYILNTMIILKQFLHSLFRTECNSLAIFKHIFKST